VHGEGAALVGPQLEGEFFVCGPGGVVLRAVEADADDLDAEGLEL